MLRSAVGVCDDYAAESECAAHHQDPGRIQLYGACKQGHSFRNSVPAPAIDEAFLRSGVKPERVWRDSAHRIAARIAHELRQIWKD